MSWELALTVATAAPSVAAVAVYGIWSAHRRWAAARADQAATECAHVWSKWSQGQVTDVYEDDDDARPIDTKRRFARQCDICGDVDFKIWSDRKARWV